MHCWACTWKTLKFYSHDELIIIDKYVINMSNRNLCLYKKIIISKYEIQIYNTIFCDKKNYKISIE